MFSFLLTYSYVPFLTLCIIDIVLLTYSYFVFLTLLCMFATTKQKVSTRHFCKKPMKTKVVQLANDERSGGQHMFREARTSITFQKSNFENRILIEQCMRSKFLPENCVFNILKHCSADAASSKRNLRVLRGCLRKSAGRIARHNLVTRREVHIVPKSIDQLIDLCYDFRKV